MFVTILPQLSPTLKIIFTAWNTIEIFKKWMTLSTSYLRRQTWTDCKTSPSLHTTQLFRIHLSHTHPPLCILLHIIATLTEPPKKVARTRKPQTKQMKTTKDPTDNLQGDCQQEDVEDPTYSQLFDDCHEHSMGGMQHVISVSAVFTSFVAVAGYFIYAYSK